MNAIEIYKPQAEFQLPENRQFYYNYWKERATPEMFTNRDELLKSCSSYIKDTYQLRQVMYAHDFAFYAHDLMVKQPKDRYRGTKDNEGNFEHYMTHLTGVAQILADLRLDPAVIQGGLLHDVDEDTFVTISNIRDRFGDGVAQEVDSLTKVAGLTGEQTELLSLGKLISAFIEDER